MASIGPSLPPHLAKRKRDEDDDESSDSPPAKIRASDSPIDSSRAQQNTDEVALESDEDEDNIGPTAPPKSASSIGPAAPPSASIGPTLPPQNTEEVALQSDDEDDIGPSAPPPGTMAKRSVGPAFPPSSNTDKVTSNSTANSDVDAPPPPQKRTYGPSAPPAPLSERPTTNPDSDSDSDSDYGPALPSSTTQQARAAHAATQAAHEAASPSAPKRDDWMLAPPPSEGYRASDPSKPKARKFNSGPRASSGNSGGELSNIWTETPEEKRKRLEAAVLGRETTTTSTTSKSGSKPLSREERERAARIETAISASRGKSLYEEHQAQRDAANRGPEKDKPRSGAKKAWADEEDDDPSKRAFDKEKDMKLGGRIGASQRRELVTKAADFGGRFAKGKFL
ncbi:hypothetical protein F5Y18DRAFT_308367 [Xylariaceae sp. FL1019]|nr:hypothetical protein F5Y18DRAFT_308367 [Xylariaceae sp. FL1019]